MTRLVGAGLIAVAAVGLGLTALDAPSLGWVVAPAALIAAALAGLIIASGLRGVDAGEDVSDEDAAAIEDARERALTARAEQATAQPEHV